MNSNSNQGNIGEPVDFSSRASYVLGAAFDGANGWLLLVGLLMCWNPIGWILLSLSIVWGILKSLGAIENARNLVSVCCPYCGHCFQDDNLDSGVDCPACKKRIVVHGKTYLRVE